MAFAAHAFELGRTAGDGATQRDHLESAARQRAMRGGKAAATRVKALDGPQLPERLAYLWIWFVEIYSGVSGGGFSVPGVGWTDLAAWAALTGEQPEPWEARVLVDLGSLKASTDSKPKPTTK